MYLMQGGLSGNFIGLPAPPPFTLEVDKRASCPHLINLNDYVVDIKHKNKFVKLLKDSLFRQMLPFPKARGEKLSFFDDPYQDMLMILVSLSRLCSPVEPIIYPISQL